MSSLPEEFYLEILSRLPVKSLHKCKCVCKSWLKLISDPSFVEFHLNLTVQKNDPSLIICLHHNKKNVICSTSYDSLISSSQDLYDNCVELDYPVDDPFKSIAYSVALVGCCNGLVCLFLGTFSRDKESFYLWNPAIKEHKKIPEVPNKNLIGDCAFGFDYKADDYVLVSYYSSEKEMIAYTLRSDSWKTIKMDSYKLLSVVFANGTFHWLARRRGNSFSKVMLVSLDINNQEFVELPLPKDPTEDKVMSIGVLEDCLSVLVEVSRVQWELWVMQDHAVPETWKKRHVIPYEKIIKVHLKLMWSFKNGDILFKTENKIVLYDNMRAIAREWPKFQMEKYVESLVSLKNQKKLIIEPKENEKDDDA